MRRQGAFRWTRDGRRIFDIGTALGVWRDRRDANRAAPLIERIEHVGFTELDAHRTPARPFPVVALEVAIDASLRDAKRDTLPRPADHLLERRTNDADEVAIVLAAQVGFDFAAVGLDIDH
jgi:hypothetical protein